MSENYEIRRGRHCISKLQAELVFITKHRRYIFDNDAITRLGLIFSRVCIGFDATLIETTGGEDHVRLRLEYPPKVALSTLVNSLKGVSSRLLRQERPELARHYVRGALWSPSYLASAYAVATDDDVRWYVENQRLTPDKLIRPNATSLPKRHHSCANPTDSSHIDQITGSPELSTNQVQLRITQLEKGLRDAIEYLRRLPPVPITLSYAQQLETILQTLPERSNWLATYTSAIGLPVLEISVDLDICQISLTTLTLSRLEPALDQGATTELISAIRRGLVLPLKPSASLDKPPWRRK